jgi:hypothetical protein
VPGPYNVTQGSTVEFTVEFFNASGVLTIPTSATLTMTYTTVAGATASSATAMTQSGSFFIANWGSGVANLGLATFSIAAPGQATATIGSLRLLNPST